MPGLQCQLAVCRSLRLSHQISDNPAASLARLSSRDCIGKLCPCGDSRQIPRPQAARTTPPQRPFPCSPTSSRKARGGAIFQTAPNAAGSRSRLSEILAKRRREIPKRRQRIAPAARGFHQARGTIDALAWPDHQRLPSPSGSGTAQKHQVRAIIGTISPPAPV